jgi:kynurenine formamidase
MRRFSFGLGAIALLALLQTGHAQQQPVPPVKDASGYAHAPRTAEEFDQMITSVSNWGRWGKDDQIGAANLISPEKRKQAAALVKLGTAVSLAQDEGVKDKRAMTPNIRHTMMPPSEGGSVVVGSVALGDHSLTMTHLDALCHILYRGHTYNGFTLDEVYSPEGCKKVGLAYKDGIVTRGVLIDLPRLRGVPYLDPGTPVYTEDILAWEKKTGVKISQGDVVILRTGRWARIADKGDWDSQTVNAGFHPSVAPFIKERGVVIVGQDGPDGIQPMSFPGVRYPFHTMMMVGLGVDILDQVNTEAVAAMAARLNRYEFMITIAPLRVVGGTGVAVNPLAIF